MALPMLVNGADCGPVNPLQGLAKRFDQDRGIQQDQFVQGRAGPSREAFRTAQPTNAALGQEAARFFSSNSSQGALAAQGPAPNSFDLSLLHKSLPPSHSPSPAVQFQANPPPLQRSNSSWAADFLQHAQNAGPASVMKGDAAGQIERAASAPLNASVNPGMSQWLPPSMNMMHSPNFMPHMGQTLSSPPLAQSSSTSAALWDKEFQSLEASIVNVDQLNPAQAQDPAAQAREADDLARTAGLLVETVRNEQNPKFKNSQFMRLMRDIRDGDIVVDGSEMVERSQASGNVDVKGKGKERASGFRPDVVFHPDGSMVADPSTSMGGALSSRRKSVHFEQPHLDAAQTEQEDQIQQEEDPNEAYFRQENEEFIEYWNKQQSRPMESASAPTSQEAEWGAMQDSWDSFEATTWGVRAIPTYEFQPHNPYLMGDNAYRTRNHSLHDGIGFLNESVLELEAAVQRDRTNAHAWFELGVKQQENEREAKAILALKRALSLDPTHLPSWLALAISHTNENDRNAADDAIEQWVRRNEKYKEVVSDFFERVEKLNGGSLDSLSYLRRHAELVDCLMGMVRAGGGASGEVDADVQIALAVLLNTSEDYEKAQDCFSAALAVRPDDWQLYNRVGATLANSGRADDALQYYYRALELNPAYIRARFNLGISCINMKKYHEAAQHILDALSLQDSDGSVHGPDDNRGITSSTLWDSLKTTCLHLQRIDLASLCDRRDIDGFRREFLV